MQIIECNPKDLKASEYNPRQMTKDQVEDLTESIKRFGLVDPIIVNNHEGRENVVVGGHQRLKIASILGLDSIPVVYVNLDEKSEQELNLRLNKNLGEWDYNLLANFDEELLKDVGWSSEELDKIFELDVDEKDDKIPEVKEQICKEGDLWQLGRHRLLCGDSTKKEDVGRLMDGKKADMVFTDPPYNVNYGISKNPRHKIPNLVSDNQSPEEWEEFNTLFLENIVDFYKGGDIYIWGAPGPEGMKQRLWMVEMGFHWSATICWLKDRLVLSPAKYQRQYEPCFYGWYLKSTYCGDRKQTEVWDIPRPSNSESHPTMKPIELCAKGITNSSKRDDIVLDLFGGSGSTLIACEKLNRNCYMMEIDPHYCNVIINRWEQFTNQKAIKL